MNVTENHSVSERTRFQRLTPAQKDVLGGIERLGLTLDLAVSSGRTALNAVGVSCILGLSASLTRLPGLSPQPEMSPSGFRSRSLLSTADAGAIAVSQPAASCRSEGEEPPRFVDTFRFSSGRLSPLRRSWVSPSGRCPPSSTSAPDSHRCTPM